MRMTCGGIVKYYRAWVLAARDQFVDRVTTQRQCGGNLFEGQQVIRPVGEAKRAA